MAKTKDNYQVTGATVEELARNINFFFQRFADRIDKIEGIRGTASIESDLDMNNNKITEIAAGASSSDAARIGDLLTQPLTLTAGLTVQGTSSLQEVTVSGDIKVFDSSGALIHSLE